MLKSVRRFGDDDLRLFFRGVDMGLSIDFAGDTSMSELFDITSELLLSTLFEMLKSKPAILTGACEKTVA